MSKAIDDLKHEHEAILSSLKILDKFSADINNGSTPAKIDLGNFVQFLKEFADDCHHGKEERMLFPALIEAGCIYSASTTAILCPFCKSHATYGDKAELK